MIHYVNDTRQITEELTLKDFHWEIKGVCYDWENEQVGIEISMWENMARNYRTFYFPCEGSWSDTDCLNAILSLSQFENSTPQT